MRGNKWFSRKFLLAIVAAIYTIIATTGFEIPVEQVLVVDALVATWILAEAIIDSVHKK